MDAISRQSLKQRSRPYLKSPLSPVLLLLVTTVAAVTVFVLMFLILYTLMKGIPYLTPSLFAWEYNSENVLLTPAPMNTIMMAVLVLLIATPLGIFAAIYLMEYAKRSNKVVKMVRVTAETLSNIPSIACGLFGFLLSGATLKQGYSLIGDTLTLAITILPLVVRTAEGALKSVPDSYRESSFGFDAGRLWTVFKIVLPSATPETLADVILAIGRIMGETAALIYTTGAVAGVPDNLAGSGRTLVVHMHVPANGGFYTNQPYAMAVVLLVIVAAINALSGLIAKQIGKGKN